LKGRREACGIMHLEDREAVITGCSGMTSLTGDTRLTGEIPLCSIPPTGTILMPHILSSREQPGLIDLAPNSEAVDAAPTPPVRPMIRE